MTLKQLETKVADLQSSARANSSQLSTLIHQQQSTVQDLSAIRSSMERLEKWLSHLNQNHTDNVSEEVHVDELTLKSAQNSDLSDSKMEEKLTIAIELAESEVLDNTQEVLVLNLVPKLPFSNEVIKGMNGYRQDDDSCFCWEPGPNSSYQIEIISDSVHQEIIIDDVDNVYEGVVVDNSLETSSISTDSHLSHLRERCKEISGYNGFLSHAGSSGYVHIVEDIDLILCASSATTVAEQISWFGIYGTHFRFFLWGLPGLAMLLLPACTVGSVLLACYGVARPTKETNKKHVQEVKDQLDLLDVFALDDHHMSKTVKWIVLRVLAQVSRLYFLQWVYEQLGIENSWCSPKYQECYMVQNQNGGSAFLETLVKMILCFDPGIARYVSGQIHNPELQAVFVGHPMIQKMLAAFSHVSRGCCIYTQFIWCSTGSSIYFHVAALSNSSLNSTGCQWSCLDRFLISDIMVIMVVLIGVSRDTLEICEPFVLKMGYVLPLTFLVSKNSGITHMNIWHYDLGILLHITFPVSAHHTLSIWFWDQYCVMLASEFSAVVSLVGKDEHLTSKRHIVVQHQGCAPEQVSFSTAFRVTQPHPQGSAICICCWQQIQYPREEYKFPIKHIDGDNVQDIKAQCCRPIYQPILVQGYYSIVQRCSMLHKEQSYRRGFVYSMHYSRDRTFNVKHVQGCFKGGTLQICPRRLVTHSSVIVNQVEVPSAGSDGWVHTNSEALIPNGLCAAVNENASQHLLRFWIYVQKSASDASFLVTSQEPIVSNARTNCGNSVLEQIGIGTFICKGMYVYVQANSSVHLQSDTEMLICWSLLCVTESLYQLYLLTLTLQADITNRGICLYDSGPWMVIKGVSLWSSAHIKGYVNFQDGGILFPYMLPHASRTWKSLNRDGEQHTFSIHLHCHSSISDIRILYNFETFLRLEHAVRGWIVYLSYVRRQRCRIQVQLVSHHRITYIQLFTTVKVCLGLMSFLFHWGSLHRFLYLWGSWLHPIQVPSTKLSSCSAYYIPKSRGDACINRVAKLITVMLAITVCISWMFLSITVCISRHQLCGEIMEPIHPCTSASVPHNLKFLWLIAWTFELVLYTLRIFFVQARFWLPFCSTEYLAVFKGGSTHITWFSASHFIIVVLQSWLLQVYGCTERTKGDISITKDSIGYIVHKNSLELLQYNSTMIDNSTSQFIHDENGDSSSNSTKILLVVEAIQSPFMATSLCLLGTTTLGYHSLLDKEVSEFSSLHIEDSTWSKYGSAQDALTKIVAELQFVSDLIRELVLLNRANKLNIIFFQAHELNSGTLVTTLGKMASHSRLDYNATVYSELVGNQEERKKWVLAADHLLNFVWRIAWLSDGFPLLLFSSLLILEDKDPLKGWGML